MSATELKAIDRILFHIESDPKTGHIGMSEQLVILSDRVDSIEASQTRIQERNKVLYRVGVAIGGITTFIIGKSWSAILLFFKAI